MHHTFPDFPKNCQSLLCKYLTVEVFEALKEKRTANGYTLHQAINSGVQNPDSSIGVYAGDAESYTLFAPLFDPIIKEYHGFGVADTHHSNFNPDDLNAPVSRSMDTYIVSTRIRVGRNLADLPLGPAISS